MLRYVCKFCGRIVAEFPETPTPAGMSPNVMTFCDTPKCRALASAEYRKGAGSRA